MRPGIKTTEFWLTILAAIVSALIPLLNPESTVALIVGVVGTVLTALGYQVTRASVKRGSTTVAGELLTATAANDNCPHCGKALTGGTDVAA